MHQSIRRSVVYNRHIWSSFKKKKCAIKRIKPVVFSYISGESPKAFFHRQEWQFSSRFPASWAMWSLPISFQPKLLLCSHTHPKKVNVTLLTTLFTLLSINTITPSLAEKVFSTFFQLQKLAVSKSSSLEDDCLTFQRECQRNSACTKADFWIQDEVFNYLLMAPRYTLGFLPP